MLSAEDRAEVRRRLGSALSSPQSIAPMPRVCAQITDLASQPRVDAIRFVRVIESDPALVGEIMRVANSPAMRLSAAAASLHQAVSWLGISEVRNIALARALRGEVFSIPGHDAECERLWHEAWLGALWAREIARSRSRRHLEAAFLAGVMHRTGAVLGCRIVARFEADRGCRVPSTELAALLASAEGPLGRLLMGGWRLTAEVQEAASGWREYPRPGSGELAGLVAAAHLLAVHTVAPDEAGAEAILDSPVFDALRIDAAARRRLLERREAMLCSIAG